jgi:hypothetical protein
MIASERTASGGYMARRICWVALSTWTLLMSACSLTIEKAGVGDECRRPQDCVKGLMCVARVCLAPPAEGTPPRADDQLVCVVGDKRKACQPDAGD